MKMYYLFIISIILSINSCKDDVATTTANDDSNSPVVANVTNSFTYTVNANQYSSNSQNDLNFLSDSLVVTLSSSNYSSGQAIIVLNDSANATIFSDTLKSNKTIAITSLKTTKPKHCILALTNLTAKLIFSVVGQ
ncbi:MAG: hypothetical protein HZB59_06215 [Ignavibacteriales bacterium]|nr:hypothetical protein [Ignavibacteriales bacterium]